jgi:hemolysin activation/secretion protein
MSLFLLSHPIFKFILQKPSQLALAMCFASACAASQNNISPNPADELRRQQERQNANMQAPVERTVKHKVTPNDESETSKAKRFTQNESPCFPIKQIELAGEQLEGFAWLLTTLDTPAETGKRQANHAIDTLPRPSSYVESLDSPIGRCLGAKGINILLKRAQDALIANGYVTSRVLTQPQDLSTGTLVISH